MEIRFASPGLSLQVTVASVPALVQAWRAGELLDATVARVLPEERQVVLRLTHGEVEIEAQSELPLKPGMRLQLAAEPRGGQWLLRLQPPPESATLAAALRQALPREAPLAPVFAAVERLLSAPAKPLPEPVRREALALRQTQPEPQRLARPEGLRQALRDSGLLLEHKLAEQPSPPLTGDIKARLVTLLAVLSPLLPRSPVTPNAVAAPTPPPIEAELAPRSRPDVKQTGQPMAEDKEGFDVPTLLRALARHIEGALARLEVHQLRALPESSSEPQWVFELPVRTPQGTETLALKFERERDSETQGSTDSGWRVTVDLSHSDFGALRAVVSWQGGRIATRFFAERAATADLFRANLPALTERLRQAGVEVGAVEAHVGVPGVAPWQPPAGLLSERA